MIDMILTRRSIRKYNDEPVSREHQEQIARAGFAAPSARNAQPWHIVMVDDRDTLKRLADAHPYGKMLAGAGLGIAVVGDPSISDAYWVQDCSAMTQNILLAAHGLGLGAVWLGCYPREDRVAEIRDILGIPESMQVLSLIAAGHPAESKPPRDDMKEERLHYNKW